MRPDDAMQTTWPPEPLIGYANDLDPELELQIPFDPTPRRYYPRSVRKVSDRQWCAWMHLPQPRWPNLLIAGLVGFCGGLLIACLIARWL